MKLRIPIKDLNLLPGIHNISVKAAASSYSESLMSNSVGQIRITTQLQPPTIYITNGILYFLTTDYATEYELHGIHHDLPTDILNDKDDEELPLIATLKPVYEGANLVVQDLKKYYVPEGEGIEKLRPGLWFFYVIAKNSDSTIYFPSEKSNFEYYIMKKVMNAPLNISIENISIGNNDIIKFVPARLESGEIITRYSIYFDFNKVKTVIAKKYSETEYYIPLINIDVKDGLYSVSITSTPTKTQEEVYVESPNSNSVFYAYGNVEMLLVVDETDTKEEPTLYVPLKDETGAYMCVDKDSSLYYLLNNKFIAEVEKNLGIRLSAIKY